MPDTIQYPIEPITLRIDGIDWTYWKSVDISRQMDAIAGTFSIRLADKWQDGVQALPIAAGMACEVLIGADPVITGYIDKLAPFFSATDHGITISGRDASGDMVDASAVHRPGHWLHQNAQQLASILAGPFGIPVTAEEGVDVGAAIPSFKLEQGESAFEALDKVLKQRELLACPDGAGGLVLLRAGSRKNAVALVQGINIKSANADFDLTDRFSDYLVQGQQPGSDEIFGEAAAAVHAETRDPSITRYRPLIVRAESRVDAATARQRAAWECSVRAARSVSVTVTVQGFRQHGPFAGEESPLWQVNALTDVDIPYLRMKQQLVTSKVTFTRDPQGGSLTILELKDPKAFQPEPKQEQRSGSAAGAKSAPIEAERDLLAQYDASAAQARQNIKEGTP